MNASASVERVGREKGAVDDIGDARARPKEMGDLLVWSESLAP